MVNGNHEILLILFGSLITLSLAFYTFFKGKVKFTLALLILAGFLLRLNCALDPDLHNWDEKFHALVAKNMIDEPLKPMLYTETPLDYNYQHWGGNHIWMHKQPVPLWTMAFSMKIFGVNEFTLRLPSLLLSTILIWFTFLIGSKLYDEKTGLIAAFFHSINGLVIEIGSGRVATDHIDIFFFFFVELAILLAILFRERKSVLLLIGIGISTGLAILCKWLPGLISIPFFLVLNYPQNTLRQLFKQTTIIVLSTIVIALPWQIYAAQMFPLEYWFENGYNLQHFNEALGGQGKPWYYHFANIGRIWNELVYIALIWYLWTTFKSRFKAENYALLTWIILPYIFFSMATTKMQGYILFTGPAFFIILSVFILELVQQRAKISQGSRKLLYSLVIFTILLLSIRFSIERIKPIKNLNPTASVKSEILRLDNLIKVEKGIILNMPAFIETMFYTNHIAYEELPEKHIVERLLKNGEKIIVIDNDKLPDFYLNNPDIRKVKLKSFK